METTKKVKAIDVRKGDVVRMKNGHLAPVWDIACGINGNCKIIFDRPSVVVSEQHELEIIRTA